MHKIEKPHFFDEKAREFFQMIEKPYPLHGSDLTHQFKEEPITPPEDLTQTTTTVKDAPRKAKGNRRGTGSKGSKR